MRFPIVLLGVSATVIGILSLSIATGQSRQSGNTVSSATTRPSIPSSAAGLATALEKYDGFDDCTERSIGSNGSTLYTGINGQQFFAAMGSLSDVQLEELLDRVPDDAYDQARYELCLAEIARRGGNRWEKVLKDRYAILLMQIKAEALVSFDSDRNRGAFYLLTALRRVEKKADPLMVLVEGKSKIECKLRYLPKIDVNLTNLDVEKSPVEVRLGGDYRAIARHNKWRIQVTDADGRSLPERQEIRAGGVLLHEIIEYGESIRQTLNVGAYVAIDKPGTYTMVVMFHPDISISLRQSLDGLIYCKSIPMTLVVEPIVVETTTAEQANVASLILRLPDKGPVSILAGGYDEKFSDLMPLESPAGLLKRMGWSAVPELIAAVNGDKLKPVQRAWALGLLYGITDQKNPMEVNGVIGPFEYRHSGWITFGGGPGSGQSVSRESMSVLVGEIDVQAQVDFAKGWKPWIEGGFIKVEKSDGEK